MARAKPSFTDVLIRAAQSENDWTCRQLALLVLVADTKSDFDRQLGELAAVLTLTKPVVHRASEKLVGLGYLQRSKIPGDNRTCVLTVTKAGQRFIMDLERGRGT